MMTPAELAATMRAAQNDRTAAWRLVSAVAADWRGAPLETEDGYRPEELDAAEQRLGLELPAALREAYLTFGRRDDLLRNQDRLATPDELAIEHGALVYLTENQGTADWGILLADLDAEDPATYYWASMADPSTELWEPWTDRLSVALAEVVMAETLHYTADGLSDGGDVSSEDKDVLGIFEPLPPLLADYLGSAWYVGEDVLAQLAGGCWLTVRARTAEALEAAREAIPAEWVNG